MEADDIMISDENTRLLPSQGNDIDTQSTDSSLHSEFRVYKRRWFILIVLSLLNISNGMIWITFGSIADKVMEHFEINNDQVNWFAMVFMIISVALGFFTAWTLDTWGLRFGIILPAWLNAIGAVVRMSATFAVPASARYPLLLIGQCICALAQPFAMFAPTKLAALWFKDDQRALANTVATVANPVGIMIANLLAPAIAYKQENVPLVIQLFTAPALLVVVLATFGVCSALPPTPPSKSAADVSEPFWLGLKQIIRNKMYWLLALTFGMGIALFTALNTLLEQILCPQGYSDAFAGLCGALMIGIGIVGAGLAGMFVDKTKKFEEVAKSAYALSAVCFIAFFVVAHYPHQEVVLGILVSLAGFFGFATNPVCLELSVECTYPVAEGTSAGFLVLSGQVLSSVSVMLMQWLAPSYGSSDIPLHTCTLTADQQKDYTYPDIGICAVTALVVSSFIIFFKCDFKRLTAEQQTVAERIINEQSQQRYLLP